MKCARCRGGSEGSQEFCDGPIRIRQVEDLAGHSYILWEEFGYHRGGLQFGAFQEGQVTRNCVNSVTPELC
jgi:hypothetical protein